MAGFEREFGRKINKAESNLIPKLRLTDERRVMLLLERIRPALKSHSVPHGTQQLTECSISNGT